ncbi:MAG: LysR family transcriptional regulator [Deltaproteobacteria bacterium]|nr:LysR family transcriptional regulator [Deltaproteobacteria bacterium]
MDLEELRAFVTVADTGSFFAAADALGVSRTTLRRRVGALEARAGVALVESTRQGAVLTEAGQALAARGRDLIAEASALVSAVREVGREPTGVLRVIMPVGMPPHALAPLFARLRTTWPRLAVTCRFSNDPLAEPLTEVDLIVHFADDPPRKPWLSRALLRVPERLLASPGYLARRGTPTSIEDLAAHELLAWQAPGEDARTWPVRGGGRVAVAPAMIATDIHLIRSCCAAGLGIALVPDAPFPSPDSAALVPVLVDHVGRERTVRVTVPATLAGIPKIAMVLAQVDRFVAQSL